MKPRKKLIDAAIANGSMDRLNMLLSATHLLNCEANNLIEEASDIMEINGLLLGDLKKLHNDFVRVADRYFKEFATLVGTEKSKMDMFSDLEEFDKEFRQWAKVPVSWQPKKVEVEVPPKGEYCNIPMHKVWPVLFFVSLAVNVALIVLIIVYISKKKKNQKDNTPLVDYDIADDEN